MFKPIVYSVLGLALSCSSQQEWDPKALDSAMAVLEKEKKVDYGPSVKAAENNQAAFADKTAEYGLANLSASSIMAVDFNDDGFSDLVFIQDYFSQPLSYLYEPQEKKFIPVDSLFDEALKASSILFYDFTGDKVTDALIGVLNQGAEVSERPLRLFKGYRKNGILRFKPKQNAFDLKPGPSAALVPLDYDLDGDLDLFVGNWFSERRDAGRNGRKVKLPHKDWLLENRGDGKFSDASLLLEGENQQNEDRTMRVNAAPVFGAQACDMDLNGYPDILAAATNGYSNKLWMNRLRPLGRGEAARIFKDVGDVSFFAGDPQGLLNSRGGGRTFGVACADYNEDGIMDVFLGELSHNHDADSVDRSSVLTGSTLKYPPKFIRTEYVLDARDLRWNQSDKRGLWFDYNGDGLLDLWADNSGYPPHTRTVLFKQMPDHSFANAAREAGVDFVNPQSSVLIDVNKDGRPDVLTAQSDLRDSRMKKRLYLFVNQSPGPKRAVRFYLRGNRANLLGVGAVLELKTRVGKKIRKRLATVSYSYGTLAPQNEEGLLFALKENERLESVKVVWPRAKTSGASRESLEKVYKIKDSKVKKYSEFILCEIGIVRKSGESCPSL